MWILVMIRPKYYIYIIVYISSYFTPVQTITNYDYDFMYYILCLMFKYVMFNVLINQNQINKTKRREKLAC
jgi:hypothetical protein